MRHLMDSRRSLHGVASIVTFALLVGCAAGGGAAGSPRDPVMERVAEGAGPEFILPVSTPAVALDHSTELFLTDSQRVSIQRIRRSLDSSDAPLRHQIDSLRTSRRPVNPRDMSQEQVDEIRARRTALVSITAQLRDHAAAAREKVLGVLSADQATRVASYEEEARKRAEEDANRMAGGNGAQDGQQRRRGGGGGRPPVD
jgi:hypothetical protein